MTTPRAIDGLSGTPESNPREDYPSPGRAWHAVAVLTIAYVFSFIDRQILNLLVGPIQRDLDIGDKGMSLLMGASFAIFYTLFGIPLGRLADTRSRRAIIAFGVAFWSLMTAGCGLTRQFWQLALTRVGVGVGEASLSPAAYSIIADSFPPDRRSTAISVYSMGIYIGSGLAFILGGLVIQYASSPDVVIWPIIGPVRPWQQVFFLVGLPGLLVALLTLTVREPSRKGARVGVSSGTATLAEVRAHLRANFAAFLGLNLGIGLVALAGYGATTWIPTFFIRRHGWTTGQTGLVVGLLMASCGTLGLAAGGRLADWMRRRGVEDANLRVAILGTAGWIPFGLAFPMASSGWWAAALLALGLCFSSMPFGAAPAAIQQMAPNAMRALATSVYLFTINLVGLGLGPTVVAVLTEDYFQDKNSLHLSLAIVSTVSHVLALGLLVMALRRSPRRL